MNNHIIAVLGYNNHAITVQMISQLRQLGCNDHIIFYDNGSEPPFQSILNDNNISYHRNNKNIYVNPAWNELFNIVTSKYLTLLNNDCFIESPNYFNEIIPHMEKHNIILSSCKTKDISNYNPIIKHFYKILYYIFNNKPLKYSSNARRQGWLMTLNLEEYKKLEFIIPSYLKLWYGDDWIWSQVMKNNLKYAIYTNRYALHIRSSTSSKFSNITDEDTLNINKHGKWFFEMTEEMHSKKYV